MSYWVEKLILPLVLMIIGGVGTVAWQYITSPEASFLSAQVRWVSIPNPIYGNDTKQLNELEKLVASTFGLTLPLAAPFRFEREVRVAIITISNVSNVRSREVEIIAKEDSLLYSSDAVTGPKGLTKKIVVKPIDPLESAKVYGLISGWPYSVSKNISAVYDSKRLPVIGEEDDHEFGSVLATIVAGMPFISSGVMFVGILVLLLMLVGIPVELLAAAFPRVRVKMTNEQQLKKTLDLIDLVGREDPAKLERARALQAGEGKTERKVA